jgi:hypothetical protein
MREYGKEMECCFEISYVPMTSTVPGNWIYEEKGAPAAWKKETFPRKAKRRQWNSGEEEQNRRQSWAWEVLGFLMERQKIAKRPRAEPKK